MSVVVKQEGDGWIEEVNHSQDFFKIIYNNLHYKCILLLKQFFLTHIF